MSYVVDEHRQYLDDNNRIEALGRAVGEAVRPGDIVLDLGSGTGVLGLFACRAGAQHVYSIEETSIIGLARDIAAANGFAGKVRFVKGYSLRVDLPEKVDVVVADQIGRFGFDAGIIEFFVDARTRFLKPGGRMVPSTIDLCVAPVESAELWRQVRFWDEPHAGLAFTPAKALASNMGYGTTKLRAENVLAKPAVGASIDLLTCGTGPISLDASFEVARDGSLNGFGCWFSARLSPSVTMTNSPCDDQRINRSNIFLPVSRQVDLRKGDRVKVSMRILPVQVMLSWTTSIFRTAANRQETLVDRFAQSTFGGMLLSEEVLKRSDPQFVPNLNPWGKARASVVNLCDGKRTLAEIEEEVLHRHSALFPSMAEASAFVAEVVTGYSA